MPRTNIDYSNTIIYKLCCKDLNITELYVGHTTDMRRRKSSHKSKCNKENGKYYNLNVYQFIRANGGWNNWGMIEIERYDAIDGYDAKKKERYWIEELKATLNSNIPTRTLKEYEESRKENKKEYNKEYFQNNKEKEKERQKKYHENNKEIIKEKRKELYNNNKEKIAEKNKKYRENNIEKNKEKITCECGCIIRMDSLAKHKKTKKHIELMSMKEGLQ
jgi:hypothetical protein